MSLTGKKTKLSLIFIPIAYPEGVQTPIKSSDFFELCYLHKNIVQALLLLIKS